MALPVLIRSDAGRAGSELGNVHEFIGVTDRFAEQGRAFTIIRNLQRKNASEIRNRVAMTCIVFTSAR